MTEDDESAAPLGRRVYSQFANRYSALAPTKPYNALYERPASLALLGEVQGLRILDAGCGPGICSERLARQGATVHGFDVTPDMIELARGRCAGLAVELAVGDLEAPLHRLPNRHFDKVLRAGARPCGVARAGLCRIPPRRAAGRHARLLAVASDAGLDGRPHARRRELPRHEPLRHALERIRRAAALCGGLSPSAGRDPQSAGGERLDPGSDRRAAAAARDARSLGTRPCGLSRSPAFICVRARCSGA